MKYEKYTIDSALIDSKQYCHIPSNNTEGASMVESRNSTFVVKIQNGEALVLSNIPRFALEESAHHLLLLCLRWFAARD